MSIKIAHAASDERGKYYGGKAGDQTGTEVYIRTWYNRPWNVILRAKDDAMREKIAIAMERLCANDKIGYDQNQRNTALAEARKVGYDPAKIRTACETDCSAAVVIACCYAGIPESALYSGGNSAYTGNLRKKLLATGNFTAYTTSKYVASDKDLLRGDILLYEGHHVAVALENGANVKTVLPVPTRTLKINCIGNDVRWLQTGLNTIMKSGLTVDGDYGTKTFQAVKLFQDRYGLEVDGIFGSASRAAMIKLLAGETIVVKKIPVLAKPTLEKGDNGTQVNYLQQDLNYVLGTKLTVDGDFGPATYNAVKTFQKKCGLEVDGVYGPKSYTMMRNKLK